MSRSVLSAACIVVCTACGEAGGASTAPSLGSSREGAGSDGPRLEGSSGASGPEFPVDEPSSSLPTGADGCGETLTGVLRDFSVSHPDFGDAVADDRGLVAAELGADGKPVYLPTGPTATTHGPHEFSS